MGFDGFGGCGEGVVGAFDELGVSVPFSSAGVFAPAVLAAAAIIPLLNLSVMIDFKGQGGGETCLVVVENPSIRH